MNSKQMSTRWRHFAVICLCCIVMALWVLSVASSRGWSAHTQWSDFRPYFTGGYLLARDPAQLYSLEAQWQAQKTVWPDLQDKAQLLPFIAPPFSAVPFVPLSFLSLRDAFITWTLVNSIVLGIFFSLAAKELETVPRKWKIAGFCLSISSLPAITTFMQGQVAFLPALAALLAWRQLRRADSKHDILGGFFLALMLLKPQLIFLPFLLLIFLRRWRAVAGFFAGASVLFLVSWLCIGQSGLAEYSTLVREASSWQNQYGVQPQWMLTARGFLHFVFQTDQTSTVIGWWRVIVVSALAFWVWNCWRSHKLLHNKPQLQFDCLWALTLTTSMLLSSYLYTHDFMLLIVACICLWSVAFQTQQNLWSKVLPFAGYLATWLAIFFVSRWLTPVPLSVGFMLLLMASMSLLIAKAKHFPHLDAE